MRATPGISRRFTGAMLVLLLHLLLLLALLHAVVTPARPRLPARETILRLLPLLRPLPQKIQAPMAHAPTRRSRVAPAAALPPASAATPDLRSLGQSLFGCAPENLTNLAPQDRARCTGALGHAPGDGDVAMPRSRVKDPARRAAEMRTKNTPGHIPCSVLMEAPAPYGGTQIVPGFSPGCLMDGLLDGFGPLNGLSK